MFDVLARTVALFTALLAVQHLSFSTAPEEAKALDVEKHEVDELLRQADSVELRKLSPRVFQLADALLKEGRDVDARRYYEKGLEGNPWALDRQLTLGELLAREGQSDALREKAELVLRIGEQDDVLARASRLLGRAMPAAPKPVAEIKEPDTVLILAPIGKVSIFILHDLRDALSKRLGINVTVASLEVQLPKADRTAKAQWVARTREQVLGAVKEQPTLAFQLGRLGFTMEEIQDNDASLVALIRKTTKMEQGAAALEALDAALAQYESTMQWDVEKVIAALRRAAAGRVGRKQLLLGVMSDDLFGGSSNFLFGAAFTGNFLGVVSVHRFLAAFNDEQPKRERLKERLLKQSLATIGFMLGVPRCNTPECARAYPQSLAEHDQKPSTLCSVCRAGFEKAFGQPLPSD